MREPSGQCRVTVCWCVRLSRQQVQWLCIAWAPAEYLQHGHSAIVPVPRDPPRHSQPRCALGVGLSRGQGAAAQPLPTGAGLGGLGPRFLRGLPVPPPAPPGRGPSPGQAWAEALAEGDVDGLLGEAVPEPQDCGIGVDVAGACGQGGRAGGMSEDLDLWGAEAPRAQFQVGQEDRSLHLPLSSSSQV